MLHAVIKCIHFLKGPFKKKL